MKITRKFLISYALGGVGSSHRKLSAAIRAMQSAQRAACKGGDCQSIFIKVTEYKDGQVYGAGNLTDSEHQLIQDWALSH